MKSKKNIIFGMVVGLTAVIAIGVMVFLPAKSKTVLKSNSSVTSKSEAAKTESKALSTPSKVNENGDIVINVADITDKVAFYSYNDEGTELEVMAVKASDGTIRTAFNTCQVCYSSGRGYYVQKGSNIVCQNCGNKFTADNIQVSKGGCNPVPISKEDKVVTDTTITIPKKFIDDSSKIFKNWKN